MAKQNTPKIKQSNNGKQNLKMKQHERQQTKENREMEIMKGRHAAKTNGELPFCPPEGWMSKQVPTPRLPGATTSTSWALPV